MTGMGELIIVTLMAGGMLELIRFNGGVDYVLHRLTQHVKGKRGAELSIAALVSLANICTANNTIAIITVGPLANDIAEQFRVDKRKSASILDTFSCVIQGIRSATADCGRTFRSVAHQHHRLPVLSYDIGSGSHTEHLVPLSAPVFLIRLCTGFFNFVIKLKQKIYADL